MKRRILSIITALALCLSLCPTWALAAEADPALCPHHREHTGECGYVAPTEGQPCGFVCRLCPIEDLIATLPDEVTPDNAEEVRGRLDEILALYGELSWEEQEQIDLSRVYELQGALDGANDPDPVEGEVSADYQEASWNNSGVIYTTKTAANCTPVTDSTTEWNAGWYAVSGNVTISEPITVNGEVHLILTNGCTLTAEKGIVVTTGNSLTIYAQSENGGTLNATGMTDDSGNASAGIGGSTSSVDSGSITIHGGIINATGGGQSRYYGGAGIGGGGGYQNTYGGCTGGIGSVTITGGIVDASSPTNVYWEGYEGAPIGNGGNATATATVNKTTAIVFENGVGTVCGDVTFDGSYAVPAGYSLHIPAGASLSGSGTLTGGGTFTADLSEDMVSVPTDLYYNGQDRSNDIKTRLSDGLTQGIAICGQTFAVSGWTVEVSRTDDLHYTATYTNTDNSTTFQKTITLQQSGTTLDGAVKTYNGDTQTTTFTASDTITVKATPTATGQAPAKAAARLRGDPTAGQMVVFVGDTQVSAPADVGEDGTYAMTVSAADVLRAAGGPGPGITLTAKFVGNNNMADGAGTVDVSISAVAKIENGSTTTYVGNLDDAFKTENDGATITLLNDVELTKEESIKSYHSYTLDLNGHTISQPVVTPYTFSIGSGTVTIKDSGTGGKIESSNLTVSVIGGTLSIESGTVLGSYVGVQVTVGSVNISGTAVISGGNSSGLLVERNGTAVLSGGTFSGVVAITINNDASVTLKNLLTQGYAYHRNDLPITKAEGWVDSSTWGEVSLDTKANLVGTVTVKQCEHTGEGVCAYVHNENTSTHTETCLACGNAKDAETCSYDATTGRCACGSTLAVTLPADLKLTYDGTAKEPAVTVTLDGTVLTAEHYIVAYANNKDAGTATVTVNGNAPYAFTKELTFRIAKKPVTAVVTAANKTYDGTPNATMSATVTEGILSGDSITISGVTGTFADENVGTDKTVTVNTTNASVTGVNAENYEVHYPETVTASITPIEVTLTFADQTIIYGETVTKATANVNGVKIVYSYTGTATGNDWPVNAGTYTITAKVAATGNYGEATATAQLVISKATLTATGATVASKTYNGNADASVSGVTFDGLVSGETLALGTDYTATGTFADANAGTGKSVTVAVALKDSAKANNYNLTNSSVSATGDVTKASQTAPQISGLPSGTITYGDTFALSAGSGVTWSASGGAAVDSSGKVTVTGTGKVTITATKPGDNNHYAAEDQITFTAVPKALTVTGLTAEDRAYDGTNAVEITDAALSGVVTGDAVSVNLARACLKNQYCTNQIQVRK